MDTTPNTDQVVIRGIVVPVEWDAIGNPLRVAILTADEGEYRVAPSGLGRRLFGFLRQEVKARVAVAEPAGDHPVRLVSFTLVSNHSGTGAADTRVANGVQGSDREVGAEIGGRHGG